MRCPKQGGLSSYELTASIRQRKNERWRVDCIFGSRLRSVAHHSYIQTENRHQCLSKTMHEICSPGPRPSVSVVIPHYNDLEGLGRCYARLRTQTWPQDDLEIVVADNNSACGMDAVRSIVPDAIVVPAPVQGAGPARNAGVAASRGRILAFLDSDCVPEPDWIMEGVAALQRYDFAGGQVITFARWPDRPNP